VVLPFGDEIIARLRFAPPARFDALRVRRHLQGRPTKRPVVAHQEGDRLELSGPFKASDSTGRSHDVKAIRIFDEGYGIIDVYVDFAAPIDGGLYKDSVLVKQIIDRLRALGYKGPDFGHSDPGLQDRKLIVLEAPEEFAAFAKSRGWKNLAEEFDE
jgi:hypothetical protein